MRKFTLLLILALSLSAFSQSQGTDIRLQERFSETQINSMDQHRSAYWTYYLDNSFRIVEIAEEKAEYLNDLEEVDIDISDFHGFTMTLDPFHKEGAYLKIKGQNKMLVIKSIEQISKEFNTFYQSQK